MQPATDSTVLYAGYVRGVFELASAVDCGFMRSVGLSDLASWSQFIGHWHDGDRFDLNKFFHDVWAHPPMVAMIRTCCRAPGDSIETAISETAELAEQAARSGDLDAAAGLRSLLDEMLAAGNFIRH